VGTAVTGPSRDATDGGRVQVDEVGAEGLLTGGGGGIDQPSLVELATGRLRAEILSGALAPGDRIVEDQLRRRYGISRAPLREALRLLAQQGLVEHLPRRGARVAMWSPTDIRQLFEVRHVLERYAVTSALPLRREDDLDPLAEVRARLEDMRATEVRGDQLAKDDAHRAFHAAVCVSATACCPAAPAPPSPTGPRTR
jgi:DNA-binding GntR family transcriptional regulator